MLERQNGSTKHSATRISAFGLYRIQSEGRETFMRWKFTYGTIKE
jgi:hypothetical protein